MKAALYCGMASVAIWLSATTSALADDSVVVKVLANSSSWKLSGVTLRPGQVAEIKSKGVWFINPLWSKKFGAGGHPELNAAAEYAMAGAHEGCLLVAVGGKVFPFSRNLEILKITGPGTIALMANDAFGTKDFSPSAKSLKIAGLPVDGSARQCTGGYVDNNGSLTVTITLRR